MTGDAGSPRPVTTGEEGSKRAAVRVLHVMEATIGGTRRHLVDVAGGQARAGLDVAVVAATLRDPDFPADLDALEALGVRVHRLQMVRAIAPLTDLRHERALRQLLRAEAPDIVHTHSSKAGVLGRRASLATGIGARVHTPHTFSFLFGALFSPAKRALFKAIETHYARRTQRLVAVSPSEAETFRASGVVDPAKVRVVPNGVDPARIEGAPPLDVAALGLDPTRPIVAIVGLVYAAKGQDLAVEALTRPGLADAQLLIVGPGEPAALAALRARAAALGVADRVVCTGPRRDVPSVLAAATCLLLPSRWEGMPYVVLEAMAARLPVVATPVDGARDLVRDGVTGALAARIDADAIADALARVLRATPAERAALGARGRAHLDGGFTVARMVEALTSVYMEAIEEVRRERR
ncbi:MAG: glycosyltransferase [Planctomycetota bacterium]